MRSYVVAFLLCCLCLGIFLLRREPLPYSERIDPHPALSGGAENLHAPASRSFTWKDIETTDYVQYVVNLRNTGCPETTVEDVIVADVNTHFFEKAKPVLDDFNASHKRSYLNPAKANPSRMDQAYIARRERLSALDKERLALISRLLGHAVDHHKTATPPWAHLLNQPASYAFVYLPDQKAAQARDLHARYEAQMRQQAASGQAWTLEQAREIDKLQVAYERDLAGFLSPGEMNQYLIHDAPEASMVRRRLAGVEVSEAELLQLVQASKKISEVTGFYAGSMEGPSAGLEQTNTRRQQDQQRTDTFERVLGEERFAEMTMRNDSSYRHITSFLNENNLPLGQAAELYTIETSTRAELGRARLTAETPAIAQEASAEVLRNAQQRFQSVLGSNVYERFTASRAGDWLKAQNPERAGRVETDSVSGWMFIK